MKTKFCRVAPVLLLTIIVCFPSQAQFHPRKTAKVSISGGSVFLRSDINHNVVFGYQSGVFTHAQFDLYPDSVLGVNIYLGYGRMNNSYKGNEGGSTFAHYGLGAELRYPNRSRFIPYALFRYGRIEYLPSLTLNGAYTTGGNFSTNLVGLGAGLEYMAVRNVSFKLELCFTKLGADNLEYLVRGDSNDGVTYFSFGLGYYF
jgi:hypothetical protein